MGRYDQLPEPIELEDTIAEADQRAVPDPEAGRDTDRDWLVRYGIGGLF
ncbi:hypothetical protein MU582_05730 [Nocardioidaceae bacterium SCSIO 66511]|nr:hypothetical protein MU582_05730 [Nocardioidaceae bacterium SCSIO 66511]